MDKAKDKLAWAAWQVQQNQILVRSCSRRSESSLWIQ